MEIQAASFHCHGKIAKLLIKNGADMNAQGGEHRNAHNATSTHGYEAIAKLLI